MGALPIPFAVKTNSTSVHVGALFKDSPLHVPVTCINGTDTGQLELDCGTARYIIKPTSDLVILYVGETKEENA